MATPPHPPRGYSNAIMIPQKNEEIDFINLLYCDECGSVVMLPQKHKEWHKKHDKPVSASRRGSW